MASDVVKTVHNDAADRCVKIVRQADGTFGFKEFRRDPEDAGGWTLVGHHPHTRCTTEDEALGAARAGLAWLRGKG